MIRLENELDVARTPEQVFDYLTTVENAPKWQPAVISVRRITDGPLRVGSRFEEIAKIMGRRVETVCEISAMDRPSVFGFAGKGNGPFEYQAMYNLAAHGSGTRMRIVGEMRLKGLWRLLEPILRGEVRRESAQELQAMKAAIERT